MPKMSDGDFEFLQKLMKQYDREARKCKEAGAPLAGCVIQAAAPTIRFNTERRNSNCRVGERQDPKEKSPEKVT